MLEKAVRFGGKRFPPWFEAGGTVSDSPISRKPRFSVSPSCAAAPGRLSRSADVKPAAQTPEFVGRSEFRSRRPTTEEPSGWNPSIGTGYGQ